MKLIALLAVAAVIAFASSAVVTPRNDDRGVEKSTIEARYSTSFPEFDDDDDSDDDHGDADDKKIVIDGVAIKYLSKQELNEFLDEKDAGLVVDLDTTTIKKIVEQRIKNNETAPSEAGTRRRKKRFIPILLGVVRALLRTSVRTGRTVSGSRVTQHYRNPSSYQGIVNQFNRLPIQNKKTFLKNGIGGFTGTLGKYRVTIRNGSKQGRPTLEIRDKNLVRKFRLDGE